MPLVQLVESCRVTSSCPLKQKFVCGSIWQSAPDSVGIASYDYYPQTAKRYALPLRQGRLLRQISNTDLRKGKAAAGGSRFVSI